MLSLEHENPQLTHEPVGGLVNLAKIYENYTRSGKDETRSPRVLFAHDILSPLGDIPGREKIEEIIGDKFIQLPPRRSDSRSIAHLAGATLIQESGVRQITNEQIRILENRLQLQVERLAMKRNAFTPKEKPVINSNSQQHQTPESSPSAAKFGFFEHQKARHSGPSKHAVRSTDEIIEHLRRYKKIAERRQGRRAKEAAEKKVTPKLAKLEDQVSKEKLKIQKETEARLAAIERAKLKKIEELQNTMQVAQKHLSDEVQEEIVRLEQLAKSGPPPADLNKSKLYQGLFFVSKTPGYILTITANGLTFVGECVTVAGIVVYRSIRFVIRIFI